MKYVFLIIIGILIFLFTKDKDKDAFSVGAPTTTLKDIFLKCCGIETLPDINRDVVQTLESQLLVQGDVFDFDIIDLFAGVTQFTGAFHGFTGPENLIRQHGREQLVDLGLITTRQEGPNIHITIPSDTPRPLFGYIGQIDGQRADIHIFTEDDTDTMATQINDIELTVYEAGLVLARFNDHLGRHHDLAYDVVETIRNMIDIRTWVLQPDRLTYPPANTANGAQIQMNPPIQAPLRMITNVYIPNIDPATVRAAEAATDLTPSARILIIQNYMRMLEWLLDQQRRRMCAVTNDDAETTPD
jgi:hypothetical protein